MVALYKLPRWPHTSPTRWVSLQGARSSGVNFAIGVDIVLECVPRLIVYGNSSGVRAPQGQAPRTA